MTNSQVTIVESWKFWNEFLAEIQHSLNGLMPGTVLKSEDSGLCWKIVNRVISIQAENQKRFVGERETFQRFKFMEPLEENHDNFRKNIAEKESRGIHLYSIEPIGHKNKPKIGEVLNVEHPGVTS